MRTRTIDKAKQQLDADERKDFHTVFASLIREKVQYIIDAKRDFTSSTCIELYSVIFNVLTNVLEQSGVKICNEGVNWIAQQYYDGILVNGGQELDPSIFTQRADLKGIPTKELALIMMILKGTDFIIPVLEEFKRRN